MGLRDALINAVSSAVTATGNIAETVIYRIHTNHIYDVYSGKMEHNATDVEVKAIVSVVGEEVGIGSIEVGNTGQLAVLFATKGLTFTPQTDDFIVRNSEVHVINKVDTDPAGASYTLTIRKLG